MTSGRGGQPFGSRTGEAQLRAAFASMDKDGSGTIDASELRAALKALGHAGTVDEVAELMELIDTDHNGVIDFEEFTRVMAIKAEDEEVDKQMQELLSVFQSLDTDGSGSLSPEELQRALKIMGVRLDLDEIAILIDEIDTDGDGEISYDEFVEYVVNWEESNLDESGGHDGSGH